MAEMDEKFAVIGAGAWGTAIATMLARNGKKTAIWGRDESLVDEINHQHTNSRYLKGVSLDKSLQASNDIKAVVEGAKIIFIVTPAQTTRETGERLVGLLEPGTVLVMCSKGINLTTLKKPSETISQILPHCEVCALSGPSFAMDVASGLPTAVVLAHENLNKALAYADQLSAKDFRIYGSDDISGVELAGGLKNSLAIAVGITRGLGLGASAEAALIARGFSEISAIATHLGAKPSTLTGLAGLGDIVLTCSNTLSRNFSYGIAVGKGEQMDKNILVEGVRTAFGAQKLAQQNDLLCPILDATVATLEGEITAKEAAKILMQRRLKAE